ncbi:MAG: PhnD/SsuA/transferrin family substrate-binding protein [Byssovorax sp.]
MTLTSGATREQLDGFCRALAAATKLDVSGLGLWYYDRLLAAMEVGDVDIAWLPPILAAQAASDGRGVPLVIPVRGGVSAYSTALFVRHDSPFRELGDLSRVKAAWVDRQSVSGYLLIRAHLRALGFELEQMFAENVFTGTHEAVVDAVISGRAQAGATFLYLDENQPEAGGFDGPRSARAGWGQAKVRVLAHAGPIPSDVLAASARAPAEITGRVRDALVLGKNAALREAAAALFGTDTFLAPIPAHLRSLSALLPRLDEHGKARSSFWPK